MDGSTFMILYGFATGDKLKYSDGVSMNSAVNNEEKDADNMAKYYYERIRGKGGTLKEVLQLEQIHE